MPLDEIAPNVLEFVDKYIDQFLAWDVLAYFHENPGIERKPSGISMDIGRKTSLIIPSLDTLVEKGILARDPDEADEPTYLYVASLEFRNSMDEFLAATRDRTKRLAIVSLVLQKETRRI